MLVGDEATAGDLPNSHPRMFQGCQRIVEDWQKILMVRSLVVSPHEDMRTWLKYASLCGKSGRLVSHPRHQGRVGG